MPSVLCLLQVNLSLICPTEILGHLGFEAHNFSMLVRSHNFQCGNFRICKWCKLPVSAREFHDFGVQETNFGELPIIMGWVREKTPAKDGKRFARAFTEERNRRSREDFVHLWDLLTKFAFEMVASHLSTCLTLFQHSTPYKFQNKTLLVN